MPEFSEITEFWGAVVKHWGLLLTGPVLSLALLAYDWWSDQKISKGWILFLMVASAPMAFFLAWQEKKGEVIQSKNEAKILLEQVSSLRMELDSKKPKLSGVIEQFLGGTTEDGVLQLLIQVSVRNVGASSIADNWKIVVISGDVTVSTIPTDIPDGFTMTLADHRKAIIKKADAIYEKTIKPIPQGGIERGWLLLTTKDIPGYLMKVGTKVIINFTDILGTQYEISKVMISTTGPMLYYPGMEQPFVNQSDKKPKRK